MAHKKASGSSDNGRDSNSKRLGVKLYGGQIAKAGNIIIRQRGTKFHVGENCYLGKDFTVHAKIDGTVVYRRGYKNRVFVSILPVGGVAETVAKVSKPKKQKAAKPVVKKEAPKATAAPKAAPVKESKPEPKAKAAAPMAAAAPAPKATGKPDDLKKIEGIGPKIASLLNDAGILTFASLASTDVDKIKEVLLAAGSRYKMHNPTTWPQQAALAADGKWDELKKWQDELDGGKDAKAAASAEEE